MTTIERLDPSDDRQFGDFHTAFLASHAEEWDRPYSAVEQRAEFLDGSGYEIPFGLIARDDSGAVVGTGSLFLPQKDNLSLGYLGIGVSPDHRRRGHGSALLAELTDMARAHGRTALMIEARWDAAEESVGNRLFAEATGFRLDLVDAHRVLFLPAEIAEAAVRDGYTIRTWRDGCPEEFLDQYANLLALIVQEAPSGEFPLENEFFDAARIRSDEQLLRQQQRIMQVAVAVSPDGVLAGHTQLVFPETDPENVYQWDTLVLGEHRGHGLGFSLKAAAMVASTDLLAGRRWVHTYNAVANGPMIAVNERLGFRLVAYNGEFIREL